ncbi:MAG: beta-lactamase family protein [Bacteroidales bacterium]|nr:beta-lactamase family protein [Bacteroidales bacterium]
MKRLILRSLLVTVVILLSGILLYINYIAPGITGYAAKNLASGVFVAGRTQESIEKEDINFFPVQYSKNFVDLENMEVTSKFLFWKSKALFNEGLGSTLVTDFSASDVERLDYPAVGLPDGDPDTIPWPAGDLLCDTVPSGINMQVLNEMLDRVFEDTVAYRGTFAVTVVYKDQIVAERFRSDFNPEIRFLSWSMAKSFTNAMVGTMVKEGLVDIDKPLGIEEWANDDRSKITLRHLMNMNSGLEFNEEYSKLKLTDATTMLLKNGDMFDYAISKDLIAEPGTVWSYSSGSSNIIQGYLRSVIGDDSRYHSWPRTSLFNKIGMRSAVWEVDASGTFVGSSYLYATMRDYARFGLLYLHDGNWMGEQVLPEGWVKFTSTPAEGSDGEYGALFWLNDSGEFSDKPDDLFYCVGYDDQRIFIIPSEDLVVVRTGCTPRGVIDWQAFLNDILASLDGQCK